ncbi:MAG: glycosyltransferase [Rhodobacteraceae bacterium]|nr:glycosyltransferase [Paracoccaceae bacterium]
MPPPPPDRPVGAAVPSRPPHRMASLAPLGGPLRLRRPAKTLTEPSPASAHSGGFAEAPAAFRHAADLSRPRSVTPVFDPVAVPPDPALIARYTARLCLRHGLLPWQVRDGETLILAASPTAVETHHATLAACFGPAIRPLPCPRDRIEAALLAHAGAALTDDAEHALHARHSARSLNHRAIAIVFGALVLATLAGLFLAPETTLTVFLVIGLVSLYALFLLKVAACSASLRHGPPSGPPPLPDDLLPLISVLIPLYGEAEIATRLLARLARIDYPADRLDILILTEEDDTPTRSTLAAARLPQGVRVLSVPRGRVRTKPRALNFGLDFCRGNIFGIWDAEDAPAPDQLRKVAAMFDAAPPDLACLQGALDFYNPGTNWIARCFTMEYALWFRLFLPGLERLGLPMPLGGTTLFLRRDRIEAAGGWDAHNVTEDADLGLRLARMGLSTAMLDSTTMEEANCRIRPWIKQRSRWSKGYLMTWLVHMRAPRALLRDLGLRRFLAVQALLLGSLIHGVTGPLILLLWLQSLPDGPPDWLPSITGGWLLLSLAALQLADFAFVLLAMRRTGHASPGWRLLLLKPYGLLGSIATVKAIGEAPLRPFHWDKTHHGQFHSAESEPDPTAAPKTVSASVSRPPPPAGASRRPC